MKLINIVVSDEPTCLSALRSGGNKYGDLKNGCAQEVRNTLVRLQSGLCAYCQKELQLKF